jgi:dipeptidyl aminopeptidase/acylaminoacyl peptidase
MSQPNPGREVPGPFPQPPGPTMESSRLLRRLVTLGLLFLAAPALLSAQPAEKKPLDHDAYDIWNSVGSQTLSPDGRWITYVTSPRVGDGTLTLRSLGGRDLRSGSVERGSGPRITPDGRFLVFSIRPMHAVVDSLERAGKRGNDLPRDSVGAIRIAGAFAADGSLVPDHFRAGPLRSWQIPEASAPYLAYLLDVRPQPDTAIADTAAAGGEPTQPGAVAAAGTRGGQSARGARGGAPGGARPMASQAGQEQEGQEARPDRRKDEGNPLILRNMETGQESRYEDVMAYAFTNDGQWLVYNASNKDGTADGVYAVRTSTGAAYPLLTGEGKYAQLSLADDSRQVAFVSNRDDWAAKEPTFTLFHAVLGEGEARVVALEGSPGIPEGWWVPEGGSISFSREGNRLFFGTAPRPPAPPTDTVPANLRVTVDIWSWHDPLIQPMQLVQADRERNRTYMAYASTADFRVVQLATEAIPDVTVSRDGEGALAVGSATAHYGPMVSYDGTYGDVYLMDVATGEAEMVLERLGGGRASFSPEARYLSWWDGTEEHWMVMDVATREVRNVTAALPHPVHNELSDTPQPPGSYGTEGWLEDDAALLVRDRYDIWSVDPTGRTAPRNLTEGVGRANDITFRVVDTDSPAMRRARAAEGRDPAKDVLLSAFHHGTKQAGFYRDRFDGNREPRFLMMDDYSFSSPAKADDAEVYVLTRQSFQEYPDLWISDRDFRTMEKITHANPQQAEYVWGDAELMEWVSADAIPLQGILIKPEGFDPGKKYPLMVYFYERSSDGLYRYRSPGAGTSVSPSFYVSRGYVFFVPDIPYKIGYPGESALNAVVPGILKLVDMGFVDRDRIGVQGHSWGGYQIAHMITRSDIFAAAEAGAPVSNMISAYGGIRWGSGMSRQFQYERTQSRIGGTLWDETLRFISNSPIFEADKVTTPLLMLHNDEDDAVPWYQGIEMYMALRRLEKPVWLFNYNGEAHGLRRTQNQKDWTIRMQQFFDHYLLGAPMPVWMADGVPAVVKGRELGLELVRDGEGKR